MDEMWGKKLGLSGLDWEKNVKQFHEKLLRLMKFSDFDYTIFWRQLSEIPGLLGDEQKIIDHMNIAFYNYPNPPSLDPNIH